MTQTRIPHTSSKGESNEFRENRAIATTDREKEISEIKQLIAKTYQVVGDKPEKDHQNYKKGNYY